MSDETLLRLSGISKTFPGQRALDAVDLDLRSGEVHALVGQNGSGKSTLAKVLSGYHRPDAGGTARLMGQLVSLPLSERELRMLHFVHQDLGIVESLGVLDNFGLSDSYATARGGRIDWRESAKLARRALAPFGLATLDLRRPMSRLSASERAIVAIARGLAGWEGQRGILVLDETTAALPPREVDALGDTMQRVTEQGSAILYITHRLDEVFRFADRVTVLRDGQSVGTHRVGSLDRARLVELMVGANVGPAVPPEAPRGEPVLRCRDLASATLRGVSLKVATGEIVGVAGMLGSGREDLADVIYGASPRMSGEVMVGDTEVRAGSPSAALRAGLVLVPRDRKTRSMLPEASVAENIILGDENSLYRGGLIRRSRQNADAVRWARQVGMRPLNVVRSISTFSGGNQQKAMVARALRLSPKVLLLDEAMQGVDVGAKAAIYELVRQVAADGAAVLMATAEDEDLPDVCHRVLVLRDGVVKEELAGRDLTRARILESATL